MSYNNILEEELKNKVGHDYFAPYNHTDIIERIDFAVAHPETFFGQKHYFLWAEAKRANSDIYKALAQLILTIGKARTFERLLPPNYLGVFNSQLIAFIPYWEVQDIFSQNDFNWSVTPSDHNTTEFEQVYNRVKNILERNAYHFQFGTDDKELHTFIKENFVIGKTSTNKIQITKNNFITIYNKWLQAVRPTISIDWDEAKKGGILDADFYLADLLSSDNISLKESLFVVLKEKYYEMNKHKNKIGIYESSTVEFTDQQKAYHQFWNHYQRPHAKNIGNTFSTAATCSYLKMYVSAKAHSLPHSCGLNSHNNTSPKSLETIGKTNTISGTAPPAPVTYWQGLPTNTISGQAPSILPM